MMTFKEILIKSYEDWGNQVQDACIKEAERLVLIGLSADESKAIIRAGLADLNKYVEAQK